MLLVDDTERDNINDTERGNMICFYFGISTAAASSPSSCVTATGATDSPGTGQPGHKSPLTMMSKKFSWQQCSADAAISANQVEMNIRSSIFLFPTSPSDHCFPNIVFPLLSSPVDYHSRAERI